VGKFSDISEEYTGFILRVEKGEQGKIRWWLPV
jgi:hypothetical protein